MLARPEQRGGYNNGGRNIIAQRLSKGAVNERTPEELNIDRIGRLPMGDRVPVKIPAEDKRVTSGTNKVTIPIRSNDMLDLTKAVLSAVVSISGGGGATYQRLANNAVCLINKIEMRNDLGLFWTSQNYNLTEIVEWLETRDPATDATMGRVSGIGPAAFRDALATTDTRYAIQLNLPPWREELWPAFCTPVTYLDLYLENPRVCIETDGAAPSYILDDIRLLCDEIRMPSSYYEQLKTMGVYTINCEGTVIREEAVTGTGGDYRIQLNLEAVNSISCYFHADNWSDPNVNDKFEVWPREYPTTVPGVMSQPAQATVSINTMRFPPEPIELGGTKATDTTLEPFLMELQKIEQYNVDGDWATRRGDIAMDMDLYSKHRFSVSFPTRLVPKHPNLLSNFSTNYYNGTPLVLSVKWSNPIDPAAAPRMLILVKYSNLISVDTRTGQIVVNQ